jgi:hypothetical protein
MPIIDDSPSVRARRARIQSRPAEAASLAARVQLGRGDRGGYLLTLNRKYLRKIWLGADEAAYLHGLLGAQLPEVTVTRIEDRPASDRISLACRAQKACGECRITWCGCPCHAARQDGAR